MITRELEVSILAAPLAAIDPRCLSQAWYSALRLSRRVQEDPLAPNATRSPAFACGASTVREISDAASAGCRALTVRAAQRKVETRAGEAMALQYSAPRSALAARIERVFAAGRCGPKRATFSLGRGNARVHVILQTKGECTMLLALCRPELRGVVGNALAQARMALAARGIGLKFQLLGDR